MNTIDVAESFLSIQGEGKYAGVPSVFLRLSHCNLNCKNFSYVDQKNNLTGCDSKHLWTKIHSMTIEQLLEHWQKNKWFEKLTKGAHLVITGGEPLLQQNALQHLIKLLDKQCNEKIFLEIETNATLEINEFLLNRINQINASPKLTSSGNTRQKAYNLTALRQLSNTNKAIFKFVILNEGDILEILSQYIDPLKISPHRIWLMAEGTTIDALQQKTPMILKWCKQHHMNYSPRLQIFINTR